MASFWQMTRYVTYRSIQVHDEYEYQYEYFVYEYEYRVYISAKLF